MTRKDRTVRRLVAEDDPKDRIRTALGVASDEKILRVGLEPLQKTA